MKQSLARAILTHDFCTGYEDVKYHSRTIVIKPFTISREWDLDARRLRHGSGRHLVYKDKDLRNENTCPTIHEGGGTS